MKLGETIKGLERELRGAGIESPGPEAEMLVAAVTELLDAPRSELLGEAERELTRDQARTLAKLVLRRTAGVPVQYLIGRAWFRDLILEVGPGVLVPRPETELLVGEVLLWLGSKRSAEATVRVLEIGTGSGCIALALATETEMAQVLATDLSLDALEYARRNRDRIGAGRVTLLASDLFSALRPGPHFDVVVSNPPYIDRSEMEDLPREVRDHEPDSALFPPGSGTDTLTSIINEAAHFLFPGGLLALEIGETQADNVRGQIEKTGSYEPARTVLDLAGKTRLVLAERSPGQ
jgi:release factor glutamine methyltransferase